MGADRITQNPPTELLDAEGRTRARWGRGRWRPAGQTNIESPLLSGNVTKITGRDDGRRPAHDFDPALEKRGGRSFGAAPSEVHRADTLTSSTGLAAGHTMSCRPIGALKVPGAGGSSLVLISPKWALTAGG